MEKEEYCPQCPNHCHRDNLMCGRGKAYFGEERGEGLGTEKRERKMTNDGSVTALLRQLGHYLHHGEQGITDEKLCVGLTADEQKRLKDLLSKLVSSL